MEGKTVMDEIESYIISAKAAYAAYESAHGVPPITMEEKQIALFEYTMTRQSNSESLSS